MAVKSLRLNQRQHQDHELKPARLVTLLGEAHHRTRSGRLHVDLTVTNDAEGPIVDPRPLVFLKAEHGTLTAVRYGLHFPDDPDLTEKDPLVYGMEFTDMAGARWRRIGSAQPTRLVGDDAEITPLVADPHHAQRGRAAACAGDTA